ncbi:MAG: hypothetical protein K0R31_1867 [Clostridiales bacterium]|nr:hypothetical protein [Clostridiales bacterium]
MYEIYERLLKEKGCKTADVAKETGISTPKPDKIQKIADYFGVPFVTFYGNASENNSVNMTGVRKSEDDDISYERLLKIYTRGRNNLTPEEKIKLAQIILADRNDH